jgi:hypothetical protein
MFDVPAEGEGTKGRSVILQIFLTRSREAREGAGIPWLRVAPVIL